MFEDDPTFAEIVEEGRKIREELPMLPLTVSSRPVCEV